MHMKTIIKITLLIMLITFINLSIQTFSLSAIDPNEYIPDIRPFNDKTIQWKVTGKFRDPRPSLNGGGTYPHTGVDYNLKFGTPILATASGTVVHAGQIQNQKAYGYVIKIDHGNGKQTLYAHLSEDVVNKGDIVKKSQVIGYSGDTGRTFGEHLHYEIRENDIPVHPALYIYKK